ncbi:MAG: hypothetical protein J7L88_02710 [Thermoplasmata archaeon]|nr:hypothetical protein [Thermoplasmata archaeon]
MKIDLDDVEAIVETSVTIRGSRRRTTVPKSVVDKFNLRNGDKIRWIVFKDGGIFITRVRKEVEE